MLSTVPGDYFAHLDSTGRRIDLDQRPELTKGSVEFVAPTEFMARPPMPPLYFFLIDVSISAVRSGMVQVSTKQNFHSRAAIHPAFYNGYVFHDFVASRYVCVSTIFGWIVVVCGCNY